MAGKAESQSSSLDTVKLASSILLMLAGIVVFHYFEGESLFFRVLGLLALVGVAVAIILTTAIGKYVWSFLGDSRTEVRKMVWPTRTEALQTTLIVIAVVILVGIFLWLIDMFLGWAIRLVIGG